MTEQLIQDLARDSRDPRRRDLADQVQELQTNLWRLQQLFADHTLAFKAGSLAWEATRLFWYAVEVECDGDHFEDVVRSLGRVKEHLKKMGVIE